MTEKERLGKFVHGTQQDQYSISTIDQRVVIPVVDPGHAERSHYDPVDLLTQFFLDGVGPLRGAFDIHR